MDRNIVLKELLGGLWHTTHPERFKEILISGAILPEPNIPDRERFGTAQGKEGHPYVRTIGAVSLFDLAGFDPESYEQRFQSPSWAYFIPCQLRWECAVWIEINREKVASHLILPAALKVRCEAECADRHRLMPEIEAAHVGPVAITAFKRAFLVRREDDGFHPLAL